MKDYDMGEIKMDKDEKWKAEGDLRSLLEAQEIRKDSKRYDRAMACAGEQKKTITSLEELKKVAHEKAGDSEESEY